MAAFLDFLFTNPILNPTGNPVVDFGLGMLIALAIGVWVTTPPQRTPRRRYY